MPSRPNNRNFNKQHHLSRQPRAPSPPPLLDPPLTGPNGPDSSEDDPKLNWYYGAGAGGYQLTFGKHRGKCINEIPYSYLKWCSENVDKPDLKSAIANYVDGLKQWIADGNYGEVTVAIGATYKDMPLKQCRDKDWMRWLVQWAPAFLKERHELFFLAIEGWLQNPPHQLAKRDIGESLAKSRYYDDMDLDLEEGEEFEDDANDHGDLAGFVETDEDERSAQESEGEEADDSEEEAEFSGGSAESDSSNESDKEGDVDSREPPSDGQNDNESVCDSPPTSPPPKAPLKRKRNIVFDSDSE